MDCYIIELSKTFDQRIELIEREDSVKSIFELEKEAIVNPTDTDLHIGEKDTICNEIWTRGGSELQEEIKKLQASNDLRLNTPVVTSGGKIKGVRSILHLPLLRLPEVLTHPERGRKASDLFNGIKRILEKARKCNIETIAIPQLGSSDTLVEGFIEGITSFFRNEKLDDMQPLNIYILTTKKEFEIYKKELIRRQPELVNISTIKTLVKESERGIVPINHAVQALGLKSDVSVSRILQQSPIQEIIIDRRRDRIIRLRIEEEEGDLN